MTDRFPRTVFAIAGLGCLLFGLGLNRSGPVVLFGFVLLMAALLLASRRW